MKGIFCTLINETNSCKTKRKVLFTEIIFIQTSITKKNVITIHTISDKKYIYRCSLKNIVEKSDSFIFISKSTIINLNMIVKTNNTYSVIYLGDKSHKFRVSRKFTKPLITRLKQSFYL